MKKHISYLMIALGALSFSACNQEILMSESYGYLDMQAESDLSADVIVKSSADEKIYAVDVKNSQGHVVHHADDHRTISTASPLKLAVGTYEVEATNGKNLNAAFNNPFYQGKTSVQIKPEVTSTAKITCSLANTMFSVEFPADFATKFAEYKVTVNNGKETPLILSSNPTPSKADEAGFDATAYLAVTGTLNWELYLRNNDGGEYRISKTISNVAAKQHYHLTFELGADEPVNGAFTITVKLNNTMQESSHEVILDFDNRNLPKIESKGDFAITSGVLQSIPVGNAVSKAFMVGTPAGLKSFRLTHNNETIKGMGLPEMVEVVGNDSQTETMLNGLGINITQIVSNASVVEGATGLSVNVTDFIAKLPVGRYQIAMTAIDTKGHTAIFNISIEIVSDVDAETMDAKAGWAGFAYLQGRYFQNDKPAGLTFMYKEASAQEWTTVSTSELSFAVEGLTYSTIVKGLKPDTEYVFKAVSDKDKNTKEVRFTTSSAPTIHNLSFDEWSSGDKMPNAEGMPQIWDSANSSGATHTTKPVTNAISGKAAELTSLFKFGLLAAGNIFTGDFLGLAGFTGARLDWGTPFTGRPIALKGYYKYEPKTIDKAKPPYTDKVGQMDESQILILLTDWDKPFTINTTDKTFIDIEGDKKIIAHGQLNTNTTDSQYVEFTIPLVYRDNTRIPKYLVIAAASSRYGDYFTGGVGSKLYLDEFKLVYDPAELTPEEFKTVFSKVEAFN